MSNGKHGKSYNNTKNKRSVTKKIKRNRRMTIRLWLTIIFLITFFYSSCKLARWYIDNKNTKKIVSEINEKVVKTIENSETDAPKRFLLDIDFMELQNINKDVVGYIEIPNTIIKYPILQSTNNAYYLDRDIYQKYNSCGSIFMDYTNTKFNSQNTVLYGHNMKSGLMFAGLNDIYNSKYGNDIIINIYTPESNIQYKAFAVYIAEPTKDPIRTSLANQKSFIEQAIKRSNIDFGIMPDSNDKILTLSTCNGSGEKRTILHAIKIIEEGKE